MSGWDLLGSAVEAVGGVASNLMNINQARINRQFQRDMSNTAHQREMEDLRRAGLNPILAANHGASTPSGSAATTSNPFAGLAGNVTAARRLSEVEKVRVGIEQKLADKDAAKKDAEKKLIEAQELLTLNSAFKVEKELPGMEMKAEFYRELLPFAREILTSMRGLVKQGRDLDPKFIFEQMMKDASDAFSKRLKELQNSAGGAVREGAGKLGDGAANIGRAIKWLYEKWRYGEYKP